MRLISLAESAYPRDERECATQLRAKFLSSVPAEVAKHLKDTERTMKATTGGKKKYLPFTTMIQMAREVQKDLDRTSHSIMWVSDPSGRKGAVAGRGAEEASPTFSREWSNQQRARKYSGTSDQKCSFCSKTTHTLAECWRANNACLICGSTSHLMEGCPRFKPDYRNTRNSSLNSHASM